MTEKLKLWWSKDVYRSWLFVGGLIYAWFFSQGIPLWDDDFTSWFWKIKDQSIFHYFIEWISPISTQPQYWGFNERPLAILVFKICHLISGYESWSFFFYKNLVYAGMGVMIYQWGLRLVPKTVMGQKAAFAAAIFFLLAPGPLAAHILHQDFAPTAELLFLVMTYVIWQEIEKTPASWSGIPKWNQPEQRAWLLRWAGIAGLTYLSYKSKADLKLIPAIMSVYIFLVRRKQLGFFAFPLALMVLLAVPWGPGVFGKLPPFVPGSKGSEISWMWQPASLDRLRDFLWSSGSFDFGAFIQSLKSPTLSLAGILGPFLLITVVIFLGWRMEALDKVQWTTQESTTDRSRTFILLWFGAVIVAVSALPAINYIFRIRYGILTMVPASILLAWIFGLFVDSLSRIPKWATAVVMATFVIQSGINLNRSINYRRDMGQVMVSVDQVYDFVNKRFPHEKLALMPDFRPYDYRPDAAEIFKDKIWLQKTEEIVEKKLPTLKTYVVSWKPSLWDELELVEFFSGCRESSIFDRIFPCTPGTGTFLMRYIGSDPLYAQGEALRSKRDIAGARKFHEEYLAKYPLSLAGHFVLGLEAFEQKDWQRSDQSYGLLEKYFPDHLSILYNRALALVELKQLPPAIDRLKYIVAKEPSNYAALINLYYAYVKNDQSKKAKDTLIAMKKVFPNDVEVNRLITVAR